jgi:signal transduction histidine kinase
VYWDVLKIQFHMINNIVTNALKFTPKGGRIELSTAADHATMTITVADTGPGIPSNIAGEYSNAMSDWRVES